MNCHFYIEQELDGGNPVNETADLSHTWQIALYALGGKTIPIWYMEIFNHRK